MTAKLSVVENKPIGEKMTVKINEATVAIIQSYLEYAGNIVKEVLNKQGYDSTFKEIDDSLIIKPNELIELIDKVQGALASASD